MGTGIDGDIDGGSVAAAVAQPPVAPPPVLVPLSGFGALVARADRAAQAHLGAVPLTYRPKFGPAVSLTPTGAQLVGIFDDSFLLAQGSAEAGVEASLPTVNLILADLPTDPEVDDAVLTIGGVDYRIVKRAPADFGSIVLTLRKVV